MDVSEDGFLPLGPSCGYTAEESAPLLFDVTNRMERVLVEGQKDGLEAPSAFSFADVSGQALWLCGVHFFVWMH